MDEPEEACGDPVPLDGGGWWDGGRWVREDVVVGCDEGWFDLWGVVALRWSGEG